MKKAIDRFWELQHLAIIRSCPVLAAKYNPFDKTDSRIIEHYINLLCDELERIDKADWAELEKYKDI